MGAVGHLPIVTHRMLPRYDDRNSGSPMSDSGAE